MMSCLPKLRSQCQSIQWTWCVRRYLKGNKMTGANHHRTLYSKSGIWEKQYDQEKRKEVESYWKPLLKSYDLEQSVKRNDRGEKFYVLSMFPYPSGKLHMGHVRVYTISDVMARYHRLRGHEVIHPMGWDAFGLPAENAAIERGIHPKDWTFSNISSMKKQLDELCCFFDWDREFATCDPAYYKWTQFIFLKMYDAGLVYQKEAEVNWDPIDQTVLADEQIDEEGKSWRSGAKVEKRYLKQWYIRCTAYSQSLIEGLNDMDPELWKDIILIQKNWMGESTGTRLDFTLQDVGQAYSEPLSVFTERPELICGVSHIVISPEHRLNRSDNYKVSGNQENRDDYLLKVTAIHPLTEEEIPIIVSSEKKFDKHNDCSLAIPCICEEDASLAQQYGISWKNVVSQDNNTLVNSGQFSGLNMKEGEQAILNWAKENKLGGHLVSSKLNDWLISRQRYWGTPLPIIHCQDCKAVPVPVDDLPVKLPHLINFTCKGSSPLAQCDEWKNVTCPRCGGPAERETDTMDTFVDSSWYYLRYLDPENMNAPFSKDVANQYMPVDLYIGGKEHAVLHLYFARFFNHFLNDCGMVKHREPFKNLLTQGMVMGQSFMVERSGKYIPRDQVDFQGSKAFEKGTNAPVTVQWEKMSKSKHNGVDPQDVLDEYGTDSTRMCIVYNVPPKSHRNWSNIAFIGVLKWQNRIWSFVADYIDQMKSSKTPASPENINKIEEDMFDARNFFLKEVTIHFEKTFLLSVAISRMQGLSNAMKKVPVTAYGHSPQFQRALADLVIMLSPITPHFCLELWAGLASVSANCNTGHDWNKTVLEQTWPIVDKNYKVPLTLQINNHKEVAEVKIPLGELDTLSVETAYKHFKQDQQFKDQETWKDISNMSLYIEPGYSAKLALSSSSYAPPVRKEITPKKMKKLKRTKISAGK